MANTAYLSGVAAILDGSIDLDTDTLKVILCNSTYTPANTDDFVDEGGASDPIDAEINVTGYTPGYGNSGRKTASVTVTEDAANNRMVVSLADITWTSVASGVTITHAILIKEGTSDDTDSQLIVAWPVTDGATSGSDVVLSGAKFRFTVPA
ncbi:MAG: hypothetical protein ACF8OB_20165 [Phycisphaeraceae bacterium JB051]